MPDQLYDPAAIASIGQSDTVGGPRQYKGQGLGPVISWKCPACGQENSRPLAEGCEHCGSGVGAAKHVGVDPIVRKGEKQVHVPSTPFVNGSPEAALVFAIWADMQTPMQPQLREAMKIGFLAGWKLRGTKLQDSVTMDLPTPEPTDETPNEPQPEVLEGTIQSRTLIAALIYFRDQVLPEAIEEVSSGQWMRAEAIDSLIQEIKEKYV